MVPVPGTATGYLVVVLGTSWYQLAGTWYLVPGTCYQVPGTLVAAKVLARYVKEEFDKKTMAPTKLPICPAEEAPKAAPAPAKRAAVSVGPKLPPGLAGR